MSGLYPDIEPYRVHQLPVEHPHVLHIEECGNPHGIPVVFVHGGPGAGCEPMHRRFFDPAAYRVVLIDQRGAGRSTPHAALENNTTQRLVDDMEAVRAALGIDRWMVFGGSWGSTLGLVYAQTHPDRVLALILRGIFLCRPWEIAWFYQEGASRVFPDYWADFVAPIPPDERGDLLRAHYRRLTGPDEEAQRASARAWSVWEGRTATLMPNPWVVDFFADPHVARSLARIEAHYFVHDAFLEPEQILSHARRLADIPGVLVHGRYDLICPLQNAVELARAWPTAELTVVPDAGHSAAEPGIGAALVRATDAFAHRLGAG